MVQEFKVEATEIPSQITLNLSMIEREIIAEMLTNMMIPAEMANNNIQNFFHKGLKNFYEEK